MGNSAPQPVSLDDFKRALDPQSNGVAASVEKTNEASAAAFTDLGYKIKDGVTDTAYKVKDVATDTGYKIKDVSLDAGDKLKWAFTNDQALDVYRSTANSLSVVASSLTGVSIATGFNNSSVPNFGRIQANNSSNDNTNSPAPSGVAPLSPTQPNIQPDGQVFETSIYNPYNTTAPTTTDSVDSQKMADTLKIAPWVIVPLIAAIVIGQLRR